MKKISKYKDFINESKLELLLEAKIKFSNEFINLLNKIESPIVKKMLELDGKEVDINRNYMTYNIDKEDSVLFYPDDKAEKQSYKTTTSGKLYYRLAELAEREKTYPIKNVIRPDDDQKVIIIKELTQEDINKISPGNVINSTLVHISFKTEFGEQECFYDKDYLIRDISDIKPSDTKVGRFVTNFLDKANVEFTHEELNDFIVKYKSEMKELREKFTRFEIVTGIDIAYWYLESRYEDKNKGSLGSSCMSSKDCQRYFDIYTQNSGVSMVILKSKDYPNTIIGRALLWDVEFINKTDDSNSDDSNIKFMDRIYVNDYSDENFFIKFARANGFYYKKNQDSYPIPLMFDGKELTKDESLIRFYIGDGYDKYPYVDTLCYYSEDNGYLSNNDDSYDYILKETNGGNGSCSRCGGTGEVECDNCDGNGKEFCGDCYLGYNSCGDCDGVGQIECFDCDGYGTLECVDCDGVGQIDCQECSGSGEDGDEECSYCSGSGKEDCSTCDSEGRSECSVCNGNGTNECEECGGDGDIECSTCYGTGDIECSRCDGNGNHYCPECN